MSKEVFYSENRSQSDAVYACIKVLSEGVASLSAFVYSWDSSTGMQSRAHDHPLYRLLHEQPNGYQSAYSFYYHATQSLLTHGNFFAYIQRGTDGIVQSLIPLPRQADVVVTLQQDGKKYYYDRHSQTVYGPSDILHILETPVANGLYGISPVEACRRTIELSDAAESFSIQYLKNGSMLGGWFVASDVLSEEQRDDFQKSFEEGYSGRHSIGRVGMLPQGISFQEFKLDAKSFQFLEQRQYQRTSIAGIFNVPPTRIGDYSRATFSNVEQAELSFLVSSIRPRLVNIEQAINSQVLTPTERRTLKFEFDLNTVQRGDIAARGNFYTQMVTNGIFTINEIRARENLNPVDGGSVVRVPLNMAEAGSTPTENSRSLQVSGSSLDGAHKLIHQPETRQLEPSREERSMRFADKREALTESALDTISDALSRVIRRERADVLRFLKTSDGQQLVDRLKDYYKNDHRTFYQQQWTPSLRSLARNILNEVREEIELDADAFDSDAWLTAFVEELSIRYTERRLSETAAIVLDEEQENQEALTENFDHEQEQVETTASDSGVGATNDLTRAAYIAGGISVLRWAANAGACRFCQTQNGKVVDILRPFVEPGTVLGGELTIKKATFYGPLHSTCKCRVVPG